ncbi:transmembrane ascorbate-dependent reductase CYB561 isoform X2 [Atheta coriaria]|uniref:transmembrane ascorbate-dependent reductase CYB561 isoform X2 n=1 Tax=Dalotia coriaria TaxID=877792 RepID=UPI0031F4723D
MPPRLSHIKPKTKKKIFKGNMEARSDHQLYRQFNTLSRFNTFIGVMLTTMVLIWCTHYRLGFAWHSDYSLQFNWHPFLMTFGMIYMFSQTMLVYRSKRNWSKRTLKLTHAGCHFFVLICAIIGLKAVFDFHNYTSTPIPNLYSMHSWIGLTAVIIFAFQYLLGFVTFLYPGLAQEIRKFSMPIHVATGTTCFLFCVIAAFTGLTEKALFSLGDNYKKLEGEAILINFIGLLLAIFAALTLYLVNHPDYKRVAEGEEQIAITEHTE